ncbi:BlaI/MecI/CopY family transcriptional regulator [Haloimpatiens sp. FM7330]|uniref:BlaI/MecI/CopY family transcriptional regulator n=1 Tax=Haloimpatiens sp. FM7330 TaxID=3298610 RepID=UPI00362ED69C
MILMKETSKISESEWEVMKIIWRNNPITANEIIHNMENNTSWKPKTIKTLISRLVKKKVLGFNIEGREYSYYPLVDEKKCKKAETKSFLKKVYNGTLKAMLVNFIEDNELTKEEIEELKNILDERK